MKFSHLKKPTNYECPILKVGHFIWIPTTDGLRSLLLWGNVRFQINKTFSAPQKEIAISPLLVNVN